MGFSGQNGLPHPLIVERCQLVQSKGRLSLRSRTGLGTVLRMGKALPKAVGTKKVVQGGLSGNRGHRRDPQGAEMVVRPSKQPPGHPLPPAVGVGGHGVEVGRPEAALLRHHKASIKPGGHGLDHTVLLQHQHPLRFIIGIKKVVHVGPVVSKGQIPQLTQPGDILYHRTAQSLHRLFLLII